MAQSKNYIPVQPVRRQRVVRATKAKSLRPVIQQVAEVKQPKTLKRAKPQPIKTQKQVVVKSRVASVKLLQRSRQILNTRQRLDKAGEQPAIRATRQRQSPKSNNFSQQIDDIKKTGVGKVLVIVGNGPSHKEADLRQLFGHDEIDIMAINKPDERCWPPDYWMFCDNSQYRRHQKLWNSYNTGIIFNSTAIKNTKKNSIKVQTKHGKGFSTNIHKGVFIGRSTVYAALQVGLWMGFDHIYVFGCDMSAVNGKLYPWGSNPDVPDKHRKERFEVESRFYQWAANNLDKHHRNRITFCTRYNPWPFIKKFRQLDHEDAIRHILYNHTDENIEL